MNSKVESIIPETMLAINLYSVRSAVFGVSSLFLVFLQLLFGKVFS